MNRILNEIKIIIKENLHEYLPDVKNSDLEEDGMVYYMNGKNGTEFEWYVNEQLPCFMVFYNDKQNLGAIKLSIYTNGEVAIYIYGDKGKKLIKEVNSFRDVEERIGSSLKYYNRCWRDFSKGDLQLGPKEPIFFVHAREPKDLKRWKDEHGARALLIQRPNIEGVYGNHADDQVFNYSYDYTLYNTGTLDELYELAQSFIEQIREEKWESTI